MTAKAITVADCSPADNDSSLAVLIDDKQEQLTKSLKDSRFSEAE